MADREIGMANECPYKHPAYVSAWNGGVKARHQGIKRGSCPHSRRLSGAWTAGWDSVDLEFHEVSDVVTRKSHPTYFWPEDRDMPTTYIPARMRLGCPRCKRVLRDNSGQAVHCRGMHAGTAYFGCYVCSHRWSMPTA